MIVALGPTLMKLRSHAVVRVRRNSTLGEGLAGLPCTLVQETLGCSVMTYSDVENSGGNDTSLNPTCMGNFIYMSGPRMRSAAAQPTLHSTTTPAPAATGFCLDDYSSPDCRLLCDASLRLGSCWSIAAAAACRRLLALKVIGSARACCCMLLPPAL